MKITTVDFVYKVGNNCSSCWDMEIKFYKRLQWCDEASRGLAVTPHVLCNWKSKLKTVQHPSTPAAQARYNVPPTWRTPLPPPVNMFSSNSARRQLLRQPRGKREAGTKKNASEQLL